MSDFFKGWRRKAGMVTLTMACVLMAGWMRSYVVCDWVLFSGGVHTLASANSGLGWQRDHQFFGRQSSWGSLPFDRSQIDTKVKWHFQWAGFKSGEHSHASFWTIPYWSLVLPLTLLSAWLILGKPRKAKGEP